MEVYQISDLERLSGIRAHTIRIWEQRYALLQPQRTDTNIRYYDDRQVKKLLNVVSLLDAGWKISQAAALSDEEIRKEINVLLKARTTDPVVAMYIHELIIAMLAFDDHAFTQVLEQVVAARNIPDAVLQIIYPFLERTGLLWRIDEVSPLQEHFASHLIRRKLMALTDRLPSAWRQDKRFLLFLPADEWHELPLLLADHLLRARGYPVVYLGQNVPWKELQPALKQVRPTHLFSFLLSVKQGHAFQELIDTLSINHPGTIFYAGGHHLLLQDLQCSNSVFLFNQPEALIEQL